MEISVVLPCLNESETVGTCIKKARKQTFVPSTSQNFKVIDNSRAGRNLYSWISMSLSKLLFLSYNISSGKIFGKSI